MHAALHAGDTPEEPRAPASDRLQLEVALLAVSHTHEAARTDAGPWMILVAVCDADIRDYIKQCLRTRRDIGIVETHSSSPFDVARRLAVDLLITDVPIVSAEDAGVPVLLTGVEPPEQPVVGDGTRVAFLLQPFNARRLLESVEHLLGAS